MSGYIQIDKDLVDDPRLLQLEDETGVSRNALLGLLVTLWCYADTHVRGDDTLPIKLPALARAIGSTVEMLRRLPPCWLSERTDGTVVLPDYNAKNLIKARELRREGNRERQRRHREKQRGNRNAHTEQASRVTSRVTSVTNNAPPNPDPIPISKNSAPSAPDDGEAKAKAKRGTRLPDDFALTPERRDVALKRGIDPLNTFEEFVDYWRAVPGAKGTKLCWEATWRNRCREVAARQRRFAKPADVPRVPTRTPEQVAESERLAVAAQRAREQFVTANPVAALAAKLRVAS